MKTMRQMRNALEFGNDDDLIEKDLTRFKKPQGVNFSFVWFIHLELYFKQFKMSLNVNQLVMVPIKRLPSM